jgi:hypothetical protein
MKTSNLAVICVHNQVCTLQKQPGIKFYEDRGGEGLQMYAGFTGCIFKVMKLVAARKCLTG